MSDSTPTPGDATSIEAFVRSDLFRAILRTQHADLLSASTTAAATVPTGAVIPYATEAAPDGWLLCTGQDVYKDAYPALFAVLGTKYGTPADTLKFRLPDLQGRVPVGYGTGYTTLNNPSGATQYQIPDHTHNLKNHTHGMQHTHGMKNHTHTYAAYTTYPDGTATGPFAAGGAALAAHPYYHYHYVSGTTSPPNDNTTDGSSAANTDGPSDNTSDGVNSPPNMNVMQPYIVLNYIIRT